ncbi:MAG: ribonuclease R [Pirellulales bacterium]|nr:ribonuclease R [Pirellulales bacterium]
MLDLEQAILELVRRPNYQPVKPRVIARRLNIPKDQVPEVKKQIKKMVRRGQLAYGASHLVKSPDAAGTQERPAGTISGVFRRTSGGYGFVRPSSSAPGEPAPQDIYIDQRDAGDASTGDVVLVQLTKHRGRHPGPAGKITEVVDRETRRFVGTYYEDAAGGMVQVDGTLFSQPIAVGDPGASGVQPNDKVVFEMVRFPSYLHPGEGVITEVLGERGKPGVDTLAIIREYGLPDKFSEDVLDEARQEADRFEAAGPEGRRDLTRETVVTIDPVDARDFDDAISLEPMPNGHWLLGVHIADVSDFVRPNTALDREAYDRGTSVYLPDRVIPMLPELISNSLASLQPGKVRYTLSALMEFTPEGIRVGTEIHRAAIKSNRRFSYEQVDEFLADREPWRKKLGVKVFELLGRMHTLAMILRRRRAERGALELSMPEVKIDLDKQGQVSGAHVVEHTESHQIIEEFMLAANEAVAEMLRDNELPFLRRIHKSPVPRKLKVLTEFIAELGFETESLESRFELQKLLKMAVGRPEQHAVNYAVLRSLQRAVYSPQEEGHYALASDCYCHFTSPIRRYPDLTIHRQIVGLLDGRKSKSDFGQLVIAGDHCSQREERAESAERDLTKVKLLAYLSDRLGEEMEGIVTGVESYGIFVQGIELPAEGLVHVDAMVDDYYRFDRAAHTLSGHRSGNTFRLGDKVRVVVTRVDVDRRELDFRLVQHQKGAAARATVAGGKRKGPVKVGKERKASKRRTERRKLR